MLHVVASVFKVSGWKARDHRQCSLEDLKAHLWMDHHQTPSMDDHLLMTWIVEQGKKEGILVAGTCGDQGGVPQGVVMREGFEGGKGMDLVRGGGMRIWVPEGEAGLRRQLGNRVKRRRSRDQQCQALRERGTGPESLVGAMLPPLQNQHLNLSVWLEKLKRHRRCVLTKIT
jgi:hypothetical protein